MAMKTTIGKLFWIIKLGNGKLFRAATPGLDVASVMTMDVAPQKSFVVARLCDI
jgi:hypothetical protein